MPETGLHMDTDGVVRQSDALATTGTTLADAWSATRAAISTHEAGISSGDVLGRTFRAIYDPDSAAIREAADRVPLDLEASAEVGGQCALLYREADRNGQAAMPAAGGPRADR